MKKTLFSLLGLFAALWVSAQEVTVRGVVQDALGPVIGATVLESGTSNGTSTGLDGDFTLVVSGSGAQVEVSCIGYATQEIEVGNQAKDLTAPIVNVKGAELSRQAAANPMSALQGMVSGVQITQSGAPGAGPSVKIRGVGSIGDYANPLYIVDGAFMDNIDFLSANDIESLTVLKDASAAAIYGVRAANGVIIVTTRRGELGHARVTYEGYGGVQVPTNMMKLAGTAEYVELYNLAYQHVGGFVPKNVADYKGVSTDWYAELVHPAPMHSHSLDLSGGTEKTNYSVGLSYFYQDGIMNYTVNDYNRFNLRARLDQTMSSWLKVGFNTLPKEWEGRQILLTFEALRLRQLVRQPRRLRLLQPQRRDRLQDRLLRLCGGDDRPGEAEIQDLLQPGLPFLRQPVLFSGALRRRLPGHVRVLADQDLRLRHLPDPGQHADLQRPGRQPCLHAHARPVHPHAVPGLADRHRPERPRL